MEILMCHKCQKEEDRVNGNVSKTDNVFNLFPLQIKEELSKYEGRSKDVMLSIIQHINGIRNRRQSIFKHCNNPEDTVSSNIGVHGCGSTGDGAVGGGNSVGGGYKNP